MGTTPIARRLSLRLGVLDLPDRERKIHTEPVPTLGGLAIFLGVLVGVVVGARGAEARAALGMGLRPPFLGELSGTLLAALFLLGAGVLDDARGLRPGTKLLAQLLAAGVLVLSGVEMLYFWLPGLGVISLSQDLGVILTTLWVVVLVNAMNLSDGLDGLAAGLAAMAGLAFFAYQALTGTGREISSLLSLAVAGAALGFLPYNFHPASIFMGDSGSMVLGLILAAASVLGVGRSTVLPRPTAFATLLFPLVVPLALLAIPVADTFLAVVRRLARGLPIAHADKEHIHHRLLALGHTQKRAVVLLYGATAVVAGAALAGSAAGLGAAVGVLVVGGGLLVVGWGGKGGGSGSGREEEDLFDTPRGVG